MFEQLKPQPADKILALTEAFRADPRTDKIDLGVGVYRDAEGLTPVMQAVKKAEEYIWKTQATKTYTSLLGEEAYRTALTRLIVGENYESLRSSLAASSSVGGTGAVRLAFELAQVANPDLTVYVPEPTWPNHLTILTALGIRYQSYRYFDPQSGEVDETGLLTDLEKVTTGDLVLLHGCCHNPTGANPTPEQWQKIATLLNEKGATVLVDLAYQGFGDGLEEDAAATRLLLNVLPEILVAASCSKNFGIYRERTGLLLGKSGNPDILQANMAAHNRKAFSFPPDHGARIVTHILENEALTHAWKTELEEIRLQMLRLRGELCEALREATQSDRFDFIARHRGMFSRLGLSPEQVERLRAEHGIYMTADSRINIAGLNSVTVPVLARAVANVLE